MDILPIYPMGIKLSQTWRQVGLHFEAIHQFRIRLFVELGVHHGGFAALLLAYQNYNPGFFYLGVEVDQALVDERVRHYLLYGDCLSDIIIGRVKTAIISASGPALVFCDNGNKPKELEAYASILRSGDLICVHDYQTEINDTHLEQLDASLDFIAIEPEERRHKALMPMYQRL